MKIVIDSSGWIEFFIGGRLADRYASYMKDPERLLTPTIVLYEVYKKIKRERGEEVAMLAAGQLNSTEVVPLTASTALLAADLSLQYRIAMADAIVYATSREHDAQVVTGDADLKDLPGVVYLE